MTSNYEFSISTTLGKSRVSKIRWLCLKKKEAKMWFSIVMMVWAMKRSCLKPKQSQGNAGWKNNYRYEKCMTTVIDANISLVHQRQFSKSEIFCQFPEHSRDIVFWSFVKCSIFISSQRHGPSFPLTWFFLIPSHHKRPMQIFWILY